MADDKDDKEQLKDPRSVGHYADPAKKDDKKDGNEPKTKPRPVWPLYAAAGVAIVFAFIVLLIIFAPHADVRTDDAYVTAHYTTLAPRVSGQVSGVYVNDNQPVRAGQLLATLDPRDFQTAVDNAEATLETDAARLRQAGAEASRQVAVITQAGAQVSSADAHLGLSTTDAQRYANLAAAGAGTAQQHQQADTVFRQDQSALTSAQGELAAQRRQLGALTAAQAAAAAQLRGDEARLAQAQLNLSYTRIVAPIDGYVDQRTIQTGDYVSPGAAMMTVVPLDTAFILANYRELALRHMAPGQRVRIHVDAYNLDLAGVVNSIPPASGATYSPVPPNNATGNFTKIVQRLPVKITVDPGQPEARLLRLGMSVETTVHTGLADVVARQHHTWARVTSP